MTLLLVFVLCAVGAFAQSTTTAILTGVITDPTQAVVPDTKITVTKADTGITRDAKSGPGGEYRVVLLPPGIYEIKVEKPGFLAQVRKGIDLTVGQIVNIDFQLAVGVSSQIVEISTQIPVIEGERSQQANTIGEAAIRNLPINRRDYLSFALLAPGVSDSKAQADANSFRVKQTPDSGLSFYGGNGRGNSVTIDGGEVNDAGGGVRSTVSQEAVQEFQINRANYAAELGGARGGVINIVTKSGGNHLHGSAFGFFRNEILDAGDPFAIVLQDNSIKRIKPSTSRQQFGGSLGGPLVKDRTFFFAAYEQLRRRESASVPVLTDLSIFQPTPAQNAVLNALPASAAGPLRAALTAPQSTIDLFQSNSGVFPFLTDDYKVLFRVDHQIDMHNQLNIRYNFSQSTETNQNVRGQVGFSRGYVNNNYEQTGLAAWTHSFSPAAINETRVQYDYSRPFVGSNDPFGPSLDINGFGFFNRDIFLPFDEAKRRTDIVDNLDIRRGSHDWKMGFQALIRGKHSDSKTFFSGRFTFGDLPAALINPALGNLTINAIQSFNLGLAQTYQQGFGDPVVSATYPLYAGYIQDTWKPAANLTLNYGVRYEVDTRKAPLPTDKNNVAPRVGFAWDPFNDQKTTVRGGYGIFYAPIDFQIDYVVNALNEIGGYRQIAQVFSAITSAPPPARNGPVNIFQTLRAQGVIGVPTPKRSITPADLAQFGITISQTGPRPPLTVLFHNSADFVNSYGQQASLGIEREVAPGFTIGASAIWARGLKIVRPREDNLLPAPVNPALGIRVWSTPYFKNPLLLQDNVYESTGKSSYYGLIFEAAKRFSRTVSFHGNYTFSRAIDDVLDYNSDFEANDQTNLRAEKALSAFDQRHKVVLYGVLQPAGGATPLFRDFTITPIFRANSARPFNLLAGSDLNADRHSTTDRPPFAGRNTGIGPGFWTFDIRISRRIGLGEHRAIELMAEGFNLFNHLNLATVNNVVGNIAGPFNLHGRDDRTPSQPLGFTSAFDPRRIQLGLRFSF
jgi:hypothetical protein